MITAGCQPQKPQKPNTGDKRIQNRVANDTENDLNRMDNNLNNDVRRNTTDNINKNDNRNPIDNMDRDISDRAENIARKVANLNDVNSATVVISGNTALVGIDMKNNLEGKVTNDLKEKVEKVTRDTDNKIDNVSVTADADLYKRLSNMAKDIRGGKPISGFSKEIQEMLRRITPNM